MFESVKKRPNSPSHLLTTSISVVERFDGGSSIKALSQSSNLTSLPLSYNFSAAAADDEDDGYHYNLSCSPLAENQIPVIDFSLLSEADSSSNSHLRRSKAIQDLADACQNWGFFQVINHGVEESLMEGMIEICEEFFNLTEEEKEKYKGNDVLDPIRYGTSFNTSVDKVLFWRDFLKVFVHPNFHSPQNPPAFSQISSKYCRQVRSLARVLMIAICEGLGLHLTPFLELEMETTGFQILIANFYPPCPQPEFAMGLPSHSDHGFLTVLAQNGIDGLQLKHNGKWVDVHGLPNSFLVNIGDHLEILSNGRYKSNVHRAVVNGNATRISVAVANGPSLDAVIKPASELVDVEDGNGVCHSPHYMGMRYRDYMHLQQSNQLNNKSCLDRVRL
ncbi:2-oxoglutarate-dependent dioxygenase 19 [Linum grandiflorum]